MRQHARHVGEHRDRGRLARGAQDRIVEPDPRRIHDIEEGEVEGRAPEPRPRR